MEVHMGARQKLIGNRTFLLLLVAQAASLTALTPFQANVPISGETAKPRACDTNVPDLWLPETALMSRSANYGSGGRTAACGLCESPRTGLPSDSVGTWAVPLCRLGRLVHAYR